MMSEIRTTSQIALIQQRENGFDHCDRSSIDRRRSQVSRWSWLCTLRSYGFSLCYCCRTPVRLVYKYLCIAGFIFTTVSAVDFVFDNLVMVVFQENDYFHHSPRTRTESHHTRLQSCFLASQGKWWISQKLQSKLGRYLDNNMSWKTRMPRRRIWWRHQYSFKIYHLLFVFFSHRR